MDKYLKYFLSVLLVIVLLPACDKAMQLKENYDESSLLAKRKYYYQGAVYRQENSDNLIALKPEKAEYYQGKSMAHTKIGDYHIAFPLMEKAYELNAKESGYYYGWLLLYYYRDYDRAIQKLIEYDNFTPNQGDFAWGEHVNYLKGLCYKQMGEYDKAITEFNTVIELEGEHVDVYAFVYRGVCKIKQKRFEEALLDIDRAIQNYPQNSMAYFYKGLVLEKMEQRDKALLAYEESLSLLTKGYLFRNPYHESFDGISIEMIEDQIKNLKEST